MVKISDLFFCFLRKKSDSFRTVGRYFCPKKPSESPEKWGFQDENKIASSRLVKAKVVMFLTTFVFLISDTLQFFLSSLTKSLGTPLYKGFEGHER